MTAPQKTKWTIKEVIEWTASYFKTKGIRTARLDAEVLLAHCLSVERLFLYLNFDKPLSPGERLRYKELVRRRALREPVSLIIGKKEFWSLPFRTASGVLIPRPDTEILVQAVLDEIKETEAPVILEIGTGSGAIPVAIASERKDAVIFSCDTARLALETARSNSDSIGVSESVMLFGSDLLSAIKPGTAFDVICSNPPYIPDDLLETLDPEINYEPRSALSGGPDGLDVIRRIVPEAKAFLKREGRLLLEIGSDQEVVVRELLESNRYEDIACIPDLAGKPRVVKGRVTK
jgi:release factor glutamine methyltransferase